MANRIKKIKDKFKGVILTRNNLYDYSDKDNREQTALYLTDYAKTQKSPTVAKFKLYDDYYNNAHETQRLIEQNCIERGVPFVPAVIPDPYIHVESQIIPDLPSFQFNPRDNGYDPSKAKQREQVVQYVLDTNKVEDMNSENERRLRKLGNAFWKVSWDENKKGYGFQGDIVIGNPGPECIFPDPSARDIDDCEFFPFAYRMHKVAAQRMFQNELDELGLTIWDITDAGNRTDTQIFNSQMQDINDDTVQICEFWFRQPYDGEDVKEYNVNGKTIKRKIKYESGDIACITMIGKTEIKYIPKYWEKTGEQNKMYPFVKYCTIADENNFWDKSEIEPIKELVDAADRELSVLILNDTFNANDIILEETNAFTDDSEPETFPGARWKVKDGKINSVRRLGGLSNLNGGLKDTINFIRQIIQETVGNFDSAQGAEPVRVTTASGIAQLNERADVRKNIKKYDRNQGFKRLYKLIDWTALEFYDTDRVIMLNPEEEGKEPTVFTFNSERVKVLDDTMTQATGTPQYYYPVVDCTVSVGDSLQKSKSFTLQFTNDLIKTPITPTNYKIVESAIDIADIPNKKEIKAWLEQMYGQPTPPKEDQPNISISYKDLPIDAQQQLLAKIGIQSQGGTNMQQPIQVPQLDPQHILDNLSEDEKAKLAELDKANPGILEEILRGDMNG